MGQDIGSTQNTNTAGVYAMANASWNPLWLRGYANDRYEWKKTNDGHYWRRLGLVEGFFDIDGSKFEGRADLNMNLHLEVKTSLDPQAFRERIKQAWSILRHRHILMAATVVEQKQMVGDVAEQGSRAWLYSPLKSIDQLLKDGDERCDFLADHHASIDVSDFYFHLMNTGRAINPDISMSRLLVVPYQHTTAGIFKLNVVIVAGHQVADGLTTYRWMNSFISLLNSSSSELQTYANTLCTTSPTSRFPPAQESLYPKITGSSARQKWFWLIARILRHTARTTPPAFPNPLCRSTPLPRAQTLTPKYALLNYAIPPRNNSYTINATLSPAASQHLISLCRSTTPPISIGSGLFVLVALAMMTLHERSPSHTNCPDAHPPFIGSFPLNPRPFLSGPPTTGKEDSLMLAFSDGISLPFLPSHLSLEGRFKLLGLQASRGLKQYQKAKRSVEEELALGARGSKFLLPMFYLASQDRWKRRWEESDVEADVYSKTYKSIDNEGKRGETPVQDFQGIYTPTVPSTPATCGISSVGDRTPLIARGRYDVHADLDGKEVVADFRDMWSFVRPRDGEFLVGAAGNRDGAGGVLRLGFGVSYDGNVIDPGKVGEWKALMEGMLEPKAGREMKL
jgi:hypothetical protein